MPSQLSDNPEKELRNLNLAELRRWIENLPEDFPVYIRDAEGNLVRIN